MDTGTIATGLIGAGSRGTSIATRFANKDALEITAVAEVDTDRLTAAGERWNLPETRRFTDYRDLLDGPVLDAVIIATPHTLHFEHLQAAMDHGLAIFCEKPLTTDRDHAVSIARRAQSTRQPLMVGYSLHCDPVYVAGRRRWVDAGITPRSITASVAQGWIGGEDTWRQDPSLSGGGMLYDTGSHLLDAVLWMTGLEPVSVSAQMTFDRPEVDVQAAITVSFEDGQLATMSVYGDCTHPRHNLVQVTDDEGMLTIREGGIERGLTQRTPSGSREVPTLPPDVPSQAEAFIAAIRDGVRPPATAVDALRTTIVTEAAYEAASTETVSAVDMPAIGRT